MLSHQSHSRCPAPSNGLSKLPYLARCVDCGKPLFSQTWTEKLKGQLRAKFLWPSKKKHEVAFGRYVVKQRCSQCREPLRCSECSEAFLGNLSPKEIRVFIKAMVLYAMKGLCVDCNDSFRLVFHELFEQGSCASSPASAGLNSGNRRRYSSESDDDSTDPKVSEIQALHNFHNAERKKGVGLGVTGWKGGAASYDWKREINELLSNKFQLVLDR